MNDADNYPSVHLFSTRQLVDSQSQSFCLDSLPAVLGQSCQFISHDFIHCEETMDVGTGEVNTAVFQYIVIYGNMLQSICCMNSRAVDVVAKLAE